MMNFIDPLFYLSLSLFFLPFLFLSFVLFDVPLTAFPFQQICVAPVLVCTSVRHTAGGGDNISAAGLVLQV